MASKRITLVDVAREAGVSRQTASHVMAENMTVRLPESTRLKVKAAAKKVGYQPNRLAQAMRHGKTNVIGVWMPVDRALITYMEFLKAVSAKARATGYDIMVTCLDSATAYSGGDEAAQLWPVDGIIALDAGKAIETFRKNPANDSTPVSILGFELCENSDSIAWDVAGAAREATRRLIAKGCKRIVHASLGWVLENYPREQRRRGFTEAMNEAGLVPEFLDVADESSSAANQAMTLYLKDHSVPDAIFAFSDTLAIGIARSVTKHGWSIPEDMLLLGYSDLPEAGDLQVPLSTIQFPTQDLVDHAWNWLLERIADPEIKPRQIILPMPIIERESTARP